MLNPVCFWREIACWPRCSKTSKDSKSQKQICWWEKKAQKTLSCLFGGRGKVQFRRKKLSDKVQAKSSNLLRRFCSNSVGTPLEFAAFRRGFDAKYSRASAFWFFLSTTMVFTSFRTHFARKNTSIFMLRHLTSTSRVRHSAGARIFFLFFVCFF